jgi:hypothetical protein
MKKVVATLWSLLILLVLPQMCLARPSSIPAISSISPTTHEAGAFPVVISGNNFQKLKSVTVRAASTGNRVASAPVTTFSSVQIICSANLAAGSYFFRVITASGTSKNSPTLTVSALTPTPVPVPAPAPAPAPPPAPVISAISPATATAGAFNVILTGSNLLNSQSVAVYNATTGASAGNANFTADSDTQITASVNLGAGSYFFQATSPAGKSNNSPTLSVAAVSPVPPVPDPTPEPAPAPVPAPAPAPSTVIPIMNFSLSFTSNSTPQTLTLAVTLSSPTNQLVMADYTVVSGASVQIDNDPSKATTIASGQVTLQSGTTQTNVSIPVNTEIDKAIVVTLANPINAQLASTSYTFSLDRKVLVSVKDNLFGASGDGTTLDKTAVQEAIDYVMNNGGGLVYFPVGTYPVYSIKLPPNITLAGAGDRQSILKAPDHVDLLIGSKFWRMFVTATAPTAYRYGGDLDSEPLSFQNLIIDYNGPNQTGWDDGYNAEQNFCIELGASANKPGRLKVTFDNCEIKHSVTDGISILANVDLTVTNCLFKTNRRGSLCILGGHSVTRTKNISVLNDLGIYAMALQSEPCANGYLVEGKGPQYFEFYVEDAQVEGTIDLGNQAYDRKGAGTIVSFKNVNAQKGDLLITNGSGGKMVFENSKFGQLGSWYFLMPHDVTFTNCEFTMRRKWWDGKWPETCVRLAWNQGGTTWQNQVLNFDNCTFTAEETTADADHVTSAVKVVLWENFDNNNKVAFNGGVVTDRLKTVMDSNYGGMGTMVFKDLVSYANDINFRLSGGAGTGRYLAIFDNVHVLNGKFGRFFSSHPDCIINYNNMFMDQAVNWISSYNYSMSVTVQGTRTVLGGTPPTASTDGLIGDVYQLKGDPSKRWHCTDNGFWADYGAGAQEPAVWTAQ